MPIDKQQTLMHEMNYLKKKAADSNGLNIQLTNNYAFRKTFKNTYIAKGFLMALLGLKEDEIADLKVTDPFEEGESEQEKEGILDVKIYLNNNKKINIEMQNRYQNDWTERSLFYNCRYVYRWILSRTIIWRIRTMYTYRYFRF